VAKILDFYDKNVGSGSEIQNQNSIRIRKIYFESEQPKKSGSGYTPLIKFLILQRVFANDICESGYCQMGEENDVGLFRPRKRREKRQRRRLHRPPSAPQKRSTRNVVLAQILPCQSVKKTYHIFLHNGIFSCLVIEIPR
jgi:hypothetical protein